MSLCYDCGRRAKYFYPSTKEDMFHAKLYCEEHWYEKKYAGDKLRILIARAEVKNACTNRT